MEHIPEVQLQKMVVQDSSSTWNIQQDGTADKRKKLPLTIKLQPDKTNLAQIQEQFRQQASLSQAIEARIKPDIKYDHDVKMYLGFEEDFNELLRIGVHSATFSSSTESRGGRGEGL